MAGIADDLPLVIDTRIETNDSKSGASLKRSRNGDSGKMDVVLFFEYEGHRFIDAETDALIGYSPMGYFFRDIHFCIRLFNHLITGTINYGKIDPTARDYADSFNSNSDIQILELPGKYLVGNLVLEKVNQGELLDYFVRFTDGTKVRVSEYLPFLDKLLNIKL